jgi:transposase-like protein
MARKSQEVIVMKGRRHSPEQVVRKLREADKLLAEGAEVEDVCRHLEVSVQTYQRWRAQYPGNAPGGRGAAQAAGEGECQVEADRG